MNFLVPESLAEKKNVSDVRSERERNLTQIKEEGSLIGVQM